jgi:hypothetical protein
MRIRDARSSADPGVSRPLGHVRGRTQIIRFGAASGDRLGNQVADHIGYVRASSTVSSHTK